MLYVITSSYMTVSKQKDRIKGFTLLRSHKNAGHTLQITTIEKSISVVCLRMQLSHGCFRALQEWEFTNS